MAINNSNTPTSTGQGQGAAQVFGSVQGLTDRADRYEAGQRNLKAQQQAAKAKAAKDRADKIEELKMVTASIDATGLLPVDVKALQEDVANLNKEYEGRWQELYEDPTKKLEYLQKADKIKQNVAADKTRAEFFSDTFNVAQNHPDKYDDVAWNQIYSMRDTAHAPISPIMAKENLLNVNEWKKSLFNPALKDTFDNSKKGFGGVNVEGGVKYKGYKQGLTDEQSRQLSEDYVNRDAKALEQSLLRNDVYVNKAKEQGVGVLDVFKDELYKEAKSWKASDYGETALTTKKGNKEQPITENDWVEGVINYGGDKGYPIRNQPGLIVERGDISEKTALSPDMINMVTGEAIKDVGVREVTYGQLFKPEGSDKKYMVGYYNPSDGVTTEILVPFERFKGNKEFKKAGYFFDEEDNTKSKNNNTPKKKAY